MVQKPYADSSVHRAKTPRWKIAVYTLFSAGTVVLISALVFLFFYTDPFINTFLKVRITEAFREAYPAYSIRIGSMHYNIEENRIGFDSVALMTVDSTLSCNIAAYSVSGIGWLQLLWARGLVPNGLTGTVLDAHDIVVNFPKERYELRCAQLRASVPDSEIVVESFSLRPSGDDEQFFANSKFRATRFRIDVPQVTIAGLACLELLQGKMYRARSIHVRDAFIDVLINKDKPAAKDTSSPLMPGEMLASVEEAIEVDSVNIWNGGLKYGERFSVGSKPATIALDSMHVSVEGIDNHGNAGDTLVVRAQGEFMKSAAVNILMLFPTSSPEFSFHYSGTLSKMRLDALNPFVDPAEQIRIKSGMLQAGSFDINVTAGRANGTVRALYHDLTLAAVNKRTGSENGIFDLIASFLANNIKIRRSNAPDNSGVMKLGMVKYTRQRDDPFFRFVWFALRSGVGDVVGF